MNTTINYKKEFSQESRFVLVIVYYRGPPVCLRGGGEPLFTNQAPTLASLLLIAMPGAPSSVLAPNSDARSP